MMSLEDFCLKFPQYHNEILPILPKGDKIEDYIVLDHCYYTNSSEPQYFTLNIKPMVWLDLTIVHRKRNKNLRILVPKVEDHSFSSYGVGESKAILKKYFKKQFGALVMHPKTNEKEELIYVIISLNDKYHWSRQDIADWLDSLDLDLEVGESHG